MKNFQLNLFINLGDNRNITNKLYKLIQSREHNSNIHSLYYCFSGIIYYIIMLIYSFF